MLVGFIYFKFADISRETLKETSKIRLGEVLGWKDSLERKNQTSLLEKRTSENKN